MYVKISTRYPNVICQKHILFLSFTTVRYRIASGDPFHAGLVVGDRAVGCVHERGGPSRVKFYAPARARAVAHTIYQISGSDELTCAAAAGRHGLVIIISKGL